MSLITKMRRQYAWYWSQSGVDDYGRRSWTAGTKIEVRWEDVQEEILDPLTGDRIVSTSTVYVDRDMLLGDVLELTTSDAVLGAVNDPIARSRSFVVKKFDKLPTIKANEYLQTVYL